MNSRQFFTDALMYLCVTKGVFHEKVECRYCKIIQKLKCLGQIQVCNYLLKHNIHYINKVCAGYLIVQVFSVIYNIV